jgi:hypothetical protein
MKKLILSASLLMLAAQGFCSVFIQYENKDSKAYTMKVRIDGTDKEVKFDNAAAAVTIQGGNKTCVIETPCGKIEVKDGAKVYIKDGCIKMK